MVGFRENARDRRWTLAILAVLAVVMGVVAWPVVRDLPLWKTTLGLVLAVLLIPVLVGGVLALGANVVLLVLRLRERRDEGGASDPDA